MSTALHARDHVLGLRPLKLCNFPYSLIASVKCEKIVEFDWNFVVCGNVHLILRFKT